MKRIILIIQIITISVTITTAQISFKGIHNANQLVFQHKDCTLNIFDIDAKFTGSSCNLEEN